MTIKEARLDLRLDAENKAHIERAAKASDESVSTFVVHASIEAADRVLARADATLMPAEQFDALIAALDVPEDAPVLTRISQRGRRYRRA